MNNRDKKIIKYGIDIVEYDERLWEERGYKINYDTGLLEQINNQDNNKYNHDIQNTDTRGTV